MTKPLAELFIFLLEPGQPSFRRPTKKLTYDNRRVSVNAPGSIGALQIDAFLCISLAVGASWPLVIASELLAINTRAEIAFHSTDLSPATKRTRLWSSAAWGWSSFFH